MPEAIILVQPQVGRDAAAPRRQLEPRTFSKSETEIVSQENTAQFLNTTFENTRRVYERVIIDVTRLLSIKNILKAENLKCK